MFSLIMVLINVNSKYVDMPISGDKFEPLLISSKVKQAYFNIKKKFRAMSYRYKLNNIF